MKSKIFIEIFKFSIAISVALFMLFTTLELQNYYTETDELVRLRILADAFTIPGVVFVFLGIFVILVNMGSLSGLGYILKHAILMLIPMSNKPHETYSDYLENRKKIKGYWFLFITGAVFLIVGIILTIMFFV